MLSHLYIRNFTLIDTLDIDFESGFSVITGETGAGKSIILGAIALLLGQRADTKAIKTGCEKCVIEAHFNLSHYDTQDTKQLFTDNDIEYDDNDCIIRRELTSAGKSRAFINDTPVALTLLKELGERLVDVHSQHQNLLLNKHGFQLEVVDTIACNSDTLSEYSKKYKYLEDTTKSLEALKEEVARAQSNADYMRYQYTELENAQLKIGEQDELESKAEMMSHAEDIKTALFTTHETLNADGGIVEKLREAHNAIASIEKVMPQTSETTQRLDSCYIELKDIAHETGMLLDSIDFDPTSLESINQRLDTLYNLERKYHCDNDTELILMRDELKRQLDNIDNSDEELNRLTSLANEALKECEATAELLTRQRTEAAKAIEKEMAQRLATLGMPNVRFKIEITRDDLSRSGHDKVAFLFSANKNTPMMPVSQVASGGETARVMLALKAMISGAAKLPTIIFDEIDTGVSGKVAEMMALTLREMGDNNRQVISITHLPQIAARGRIHYRAAKEDTTTGTISRMTRLDDEQRITEIAQMLSGSDISEAAINNAKELLKG